MACVILHYIQGGPECRQWSVGEPARGNAT